MISPAQLTRSAVSLGARSGRTCLHPAALFPAQQQTRQQKHSRDGAQSHTHSDPSRCRRQISSFAKTLTVRVATYLAKEIAALFRPVSYHPLMSLTEDDTRPLLTSEFWVHPGYEELLHAASRFNLSPTAELKRPTSNLVKIASHVKAKPGDAVMQEISTLQ